METIDTVNINQEDFSLEKFTYQKKLTQKLDNISGDFDQNIINEIVLWKVSRYAALSEDAITKLNKISSNAKKLDINLTREILEALLACSGIRLPMASTILRFKNPAIYQIIDQRVYRFLYGEELVNNKNSIDLYIDYLDYLRKKCNEYKIPFKYSDRILYLADKRENKKISLNNYGTNSQKG